MEAILVIILIGLAGGVAVGLQRALNGEWTAYE